MFGDSFLDMAEAMLGKSYNRTSSSCDVLNSSSSELNDKCNTETGKKGASSSVLGEKCSTNKVKSTVSTCKTDLQDSRPTDSSDRKNDRRRSVVIELPPKRQRIKGNYSAVDIIQALNGAMSREERKEALENAM